MVISRYFYLLFRSSGIWSLFFRIIAFNIILLIDGATLLWLASNWLAFASLAFAAIFGLFSAFLVGNSLLRHIHKMESEIKQGMFPSQEFRQILGLLIATFLAIIPGLFSTTLGLLIFIKPIRMLIGNAVASGLSRELEELYQHLRANL